MTKKSVREMGKMERKRHSLTTKSALGVQLLAFIVGITVLFAGFALYFVAVFYEYSINTAKLAKAEAVMLDVAETRVKTDEIIEIYDSIPEEERGDGTSAEYQAKFDSVIDGDYRNIQRRQRIMKEQVGLRNAFIVAIDDEKNRMIYLIDSDPNPATVCHPGTWDVYTDQEIDVLLHGRKASKIQIEYGLDDRPQATITNTSKYGIRCTGGTTLYSTDSYTVMLCLDEKMDHMISISKVFFLQYVLLMFVVLVIIGALSILLIRRTMVKPINRMASAARRYSEDKQNGIAETDHFKQLNIRSGDEIEELNLTMADMEDSLVKYIDNLTKATAERERINIELELAARIQGDMLPTTFPPFPERDDFDVFAVMDPAKQVGGDFYDFFLIDDDHLALMIADVSGKGIPAALYMMVSKIILDNRLMETSSPSKSLEHANNVICSNNKEEMFVTAWLGILELSTGRLTAANAGHEKPVVIDPDGRAELIRDKHGFVLGGMEGMKYTDYELQLKPGSKLLVYTDGVPEATSGIEGLFGTDRMMDAIEGLSEASAREVLERVRCAVDEFVGDDEQFDDLTMLCLQYNRECIAAGESGE